MYRCWKANRIMEKLCTRPRKKSNIAYSLSWFLKNGESLVGEEDVECTPDEVRKWFGLPEGDPACFCYDVSPVQVPMIQSRIRHKINLEQYDYSLECYNPSF